MIRRGGNIYFNFYDYVLVFCIKRSAKIALGFVAELGFLVVSQSAPDRGLSRPTLSCIFMRTLTLFLLLVIFIIFIT